MVPQPIRIAKNTTYLTTAYVIQKIFSFLYFILIARMIGVESIGKYVFALSFTTIFGIFIDLGLSQVLTREVAKNWGKAKEYLNNIIGVKSFLAVIVYLLAITTISFLDKAPMVRELVYISGIIMVLDSFYLSFYAVFRAAQNLKYEAVGMVVGQIIILVTGAVVLFFHLSLHFLIGAILAGSIFNFLYSFILLEVKVKLSVRPSYNKETLKLLFKIAAPFAVAGIFARVYSQIDSVLLSILAGDEAVGWYSAGYKITFALQFIPMAMAAALYPAMSNFFVNNKKQLARVLEKSLYYLMIIALPLSFGVVVLAKEFIVTIYGAEFEPTALALQILIFSLFFNFLSFPLGSLLNACNRQTRNTVNMGITMVVNVILNLVLITLFVEYAYIGASIAALASQFTLFSLGLYWVGKVIKYNKKFLVKGFGKVLGACFLMIVVILLLKPGVYFLFLIPVGGIIYFFSLYAFKGINKKEFKELYYSFKK